ncbi:MAG: hypothetical protein AAF525_11235 [Pseudomonadota bacterium]
MIEKQNTLDVLQPVRPGFRYRKEGISTHLRRWLSIVLMSVLPVSAGAEDVVKESGNGGINWTDGTVFATGYGTAKAGTSRGQHKILSIRAARLDAQRNLLEITKGVRINSTVTVDSAMKESRTILSRVDGIVKGARVVSENYHNDVATVRMAMPIAGDLILATTARQDVIASRPSPLLDQLLAVLVPPAYAKPFIVESDYEAQAYEKLLKWMADESGELESVLKEAVIAYNTNKRFSGLLIDARRVAEFELATIPKIRNESGEIIYPNDDTSYDDIVNRRGVTYDFDLEDAVRNKRVAQTPFVIEATGTYKGQASDLTIAVSDATRLRQSPSTVFAMNRAGVLIVVAD